MRVTIVSGIFPPDAGGPASYVPRIASALVARGHIVTVTTLSDSVADTYASYDYPVGRILRQQRKWCRIPRTVDEILKRARRSDLVFANGLFLEAVVAARMARKPLVSKIVGDWAWERNRGLGKINDTLDEFQKKRYGPSVQALKMLRKHLSRCADAVITPSHYLQRIVAGWGVAPQRLHVIYNALEPPSQSSPKPELPPFAGPTIITVGRLVAWKGIDRLLEVVATMPRVRLAIVGDGPERSRLERIAVGLQLAERAVFVGQVPSQRVSDYLRAADLFVLNSDYEGLPHIVLEAMQAGVPVIATEVGGSPEVIEHGVNGLLVPPGDNDALRRAIGHVLDNGELATSLVAEGECRVQVEFSWDKLVERTESLLQRTAMPKGTQCAS